jgi:hypothetical protein
MIRFAAEAFLLDDFASSFLCQFVDTMSLADVACHGWQAGSQKAYQLVMYAWRNSVLLDWHSNIQWAI